MRPKLPDLIRLSPYIKIIDQCRNYSNFGRLAIKLEERLGHRLGLERVASVSSATIGITLALAALNARPGTLCVIPAWTFIASAHAATMAGLIPYFVDVDKESWALCPDTVAKTIADAPNEVGAIMPVMPFGQKLDSAAWDRFSVTSGIPVVIDAAAAFDTITPSAVPVVVSLHATKILGIGEGGFVSSTDSTLVEEIRTRSNFGFSGSREAQLPAANAKLSEYHAAVGMAALDEWAIARDEWMSVAACYRDAMSQSEALKMQTGFGESWIAATCVVDLLDTTTDLAEVSLARAGIETRRWWGGGAHRHPATAAFPRGSLDTTHALAKSTLGLPFFRDLTQAEVARVVDNLMMVATYPRLV